MYLVRLLTIILIVLSTSLSGAMAASHAGTADMTVMSVDHESCCEGSMQQSPSCHAVPAIIPTMTMSWAAPEAMQSVTFELAILLTGTEPSGTLDPPRAV